MPQTSDRRPRRPRPPSAPATLSLPIIPLDVAPGTSAGRTSRAQRDGASPERPDASHVSRPRPTISGDGWDERDDDTPPPARSLVSSRSQPRWPMAPVSQPRALAVSVPRLATPPTRTVRRGVLWQTLLLAIVIATFLTSLHGIDGVNSALASAFQSQVFAHEDIKVTQKVPTFTQIDPTIGYLSTQQYNTYWKADCGAAATSEVLTAWGDPHGAIGYVINDMAPFLSSAGMVDPPDAFRAIAAKHHLSMVMTNNITAAQLFQIVQVQGIPVIVGVRDTFGGYYRYFAPGHFLVVTGADANGFQIVDSSTYFVHYLPTATFMSLWDFPRAVIYTPPDYGFQFP